MNLLYSLPMFLAQDDMVTYQSQGNPLVAIIGGLFGLAIVLVFLGILIMGILTKAGFPAWSAFVPFYNLALLCRAAGLSGWLMLVAIIPFVGGIIFAIIVGIGLGKTFNKSGGFVAGLVLLGIIFYPILGYGDSRYVGNTGGTLPGGNPPPYPTV